MSLVPPDKEDFPPLSPANPLSPPQTHSSIPPAIPSSKAPTYAQRFKSSLRNLRKISSPSFDGDGIPIIDAPHSILLSASETWKDHILAKFHGSIPPIKKIYSDLNPVWGKQGNITIHVISTTACLIYVPSVPLREWVIDVGYWQVANCALSVSLWTPEASLEPEDLVSAPTWVILKSVPPQLYSLDGISVIASGIGDPLHTEKSRLPPYHLGDTKVKVEINLENQPPSAVIVRDSMGFTARIEISYPRLPPKCCNCGKFGHLLNCCPVPLQKIKVKEMLNTPRESSMAEVFVSDPEVSLTTECQNIVSPPLPVVFEEVPPDANLASNAPTSASVDPQEKEISVMNSDLEAKGSKVKILSHRSDPSKKLIIPVSSDPPDSADFPLEPGSLAAKTALASALIESSGLEEGEIPFQPSPAAARKARKKLRREALKKLDSPSAAVPQLFSSIREISLGRRNQRH